MVEVSQGGGKMLSQIFLYVEYQHFSTIVG